MSDLLSREEIEELRRIWCGSSSDYDQLKTALDMALACHDERDQQADKGDASDAFTDLRKQLAEQSERVKELESSCAKVSRFIEALDKANTESTDMEAAVSASLNEAMAYDVLQETEKERDSLRAQLEELKGQSK